MKGWALSGRHAEVRSSRPLRKFLPLISAVALAGVLVGAATAAMGLGPADDRSAVAADSATVAVDGSPTTNPSPLPSRSTDDRASRSGLRAMPSPSPSATSKSPTPRPKKVTPTQPSGGGSVSSSGSCGISYYSDGEKTANGEAFDPNAFTAASKTLPFNTRVRVTNPANGKSVVVRINDRGPFVSGRCLDLTRAAFAAIASLGSGVLSSAKWEVLS
jgi:rare lipoprotein A